MDKTYWAMLALPRPGHLQQGAEGIINMPVRLPHGACNQRHVPWWLTTPSRCIRQVLGAYYNKARRFYEEVLAVRGGELLHMLQAKAAKDPSWPADLHLYPSTSRYRVLRSQGRVALVEMEPLTGRKHQLRIHAQFSLGSPVIGEDKYLVGERRRTLLEGLARELELRVDKAPHPLQRTGHGEEGPDEDGLDTDYLANVLAPGRGQASSHRLLTRHLHLHARGLVFHRAGSEPPIRIEAPPPPHFVSLMERLGWSDLLKTTVS